MARYGVQVIGRGRQCFVVANIPGEGGFKKGPMPEDEAMELAESLVVELTRLQAPRLVESVKRELSRARRTSVRSAGVVGFVLVLAAFIWFLVTR